MWLRAAGSGESVERLELERRCCAGRRVRDMMGWRVAGKEERKD